jgi:prephenate dehydrogenase
MSQELRIALLGAGQLGGSFALALRSADPGLHITAYDPVAASAQTLVDIGGASVTAANAADAVRDADLVIFAAPVRAFRMLAESISGALAPGAIVTDLGSVKTSMLPIASLLPTARVVPGHPIAGSEKAGIGVARADLFRGKLAILTPLENSDPEAVAAVETLWHSVGADVLSMPVEVHDHIYAYMSHLPHLVAFVAASYLHAQGARLEANDAVLQRFLRISRSNVRMWSDIFLENREALLPALAAYIAILNHFADELRQGKEVIGDRVVLAKAHLPRILAASLISSVSLYEQQSGMELRPFGGAGMRDIAAPAADDPEKVMQAISDHASVIAQLIDGILPSFQQIEKLIGAEDEEGLYAFVSRLRHDADALTAPRQ